MHCIQTQPWKSPRAGSRPFAMSSACQEWPRRVRGRGSDEEGPLTQRTALLTIVLHLAILETYFAVIKHAHYVAIWILVSFSGVQCGYNKLCRTAPLLSFVPVTLAVRIISSTRRNLAQTSFREPNLAAGVIYMSNHTIVNIWERILMSHLIL